MCSILTSGGIAPDLGCVREVLSYDGEGNLQGVREQVRLAGFGQVDRRYGMSYDRRDRLVLEWRDSALEPPENPRRRQVEYGYDAADNVTLVKDDGVTSVTYRYDEQNWLERATLANGVTVNPVVVARMNSRIVSRVRKSVPAQVALIWENSRCSMGLYLEHPVGKWQTVTLTPN